MLCQHWDLVVVEGCSWTFSQFAIAANMPCLLRRACLAKSWSILFECSTQAAVCQAAHRLHACTIGISFSHLCLCLKSCQSASLPALQSACSDAPNLSSLLVSKLGSSFMHVCGHAQYRCVYHACGLLCRNHRGLRHYWGLRVKGQHTKTTGRRGKTVGVAKKR